MGSGGPHRRRFGRRVSLGFGGVALALVAACSGPGFTYVSNTQENAFFKVPAEWTVYDQKDLLQAAYQNPSPQELQEIEQTIWATGFDAAEDPAIGHVLTFLSAAPAGLASVRALDEEEREIVSLESMGRPAQFGLLEEQDPEAVREVESEDLVLEGGIHGRRVVFDVAPATLPVSLTFNQTVLVDPPAEKLYVFAVGCSATCYRENEEEIEEVVDSWTIKER